MSLMPTQPRLLSELRMSRIFFYIMFVSAISSGARCAWADSAVAASEIIPNQPFGRSEPTATQPTSMPAPGLSEPPDSQAIRKQITKLGHPIPSVREQAIAQLVAWGTATLPLLSEAAQSEQFELAIAARQLLNEMQKAYLLGATIRLSCDRTTIAWNQPIALTLVIDNRGHGPTRLPWAKRPPATQPAHLSADIAQVSAIMDVADFLTVTAPDGHEVELRIESIDRAPAIRQCVNVRAVGQLQDLSLAPGHQNRLTIERFNRGWARYPLLAEGTYTIQFHYQPLWSNPAWQQAGIGQIQSDPLRINVNQPAPTAIRQANTAMKLETQQKGQQLLFQLTNQWDRSLWINLNLGNDLSTHGALSWRANPTDGSNQQINLSYNGYSSFDSKRFEKLEPGQSLVLYRIAIDELFNTIHTLGGADWNQILLTTRYTHLSDPPSLRQQFSEPALTIPTHLYAGSVEADPITLTHSP